MAGPESLEPERLRPFLKSLALVLLSPKLRGVVDASDIVQKTLLDAHRNRQQFQGSTEAELKAWLRQMLLHDLLDEVERFRKRTPEAGLGGALLDSTGRLQAQTSPSGRAVRKEEAVRLAAAVALLPEHQRSAVELHHLQEFSVQETALRMGRTPGSVASLIHRGLSELRVLMGESRP